MKTLLIYQFTKLSTQKMTIEVVLTKSYYQQVYLQQVDLKFICSNALCILGKLCFFHFRCVRSYYFQKLCCHLRLNTLWNHTLQAELHIYEICNNCWRCWRFYYWYFQLIYHKILFNFPCKTLQVNFDPLSFDLFWWQYNICMTLRIRWWSLWLWEWGLKWVVAIKVYNLMGKILTPIPACVMMTLGDGDL